DNRSTFEMFASSDLVVEGETIKLFCGAEVDALRGDEPIELKTTPEHSLNSYWRNMKIVLQSEIVGINAIVIGLKGTKEAGTKHILHEVIY
ncbi:hypothetical protein PENTCL1PPCAC_3681, partial [Pristionchus entomophagus]